MRKAIAMSLELFPTSTRHIVHRRDVTGAGGPSTGSDGLRESRGEFFPKFLRNQMRSEMPLSGAVWEFEKVTPK